MICSRGCGSQLRIKKDVRQMPNMLDYLSREGDISLTESPISPVDALLVSALSYIQFDHLISGNPLEAPRLSELSQMFQELSKEGKKSRFRHPLDEELLEGMGKSRRFGSLRLTGARELTDEKKELQFAAVALLLEDGGALAAFRGTDGTLTGWKEDLNMSFLDVIPGQQAARDYLQGIGRLCPGKLYAAGHSKGGNLAVYAAVRSGEEIRGRIGGVYNYDGPGFRQKVLEDPGYLELLDRIHTFVPQGSVVGMLLEHEEPYQVVQSTEEGLLQHEPYSWEVSGDGFVELGQVTEGSRMVDETIKSWLAGLSVKEREHFIDTLFEILGASGAEHVGDLAKPGSLFAILKKLGGEDDETKKMLIRILMQLVKAAAGVVYPNLQD